MCSEAEQITLPNSVGGWCTGDCLEDGCRWGYNCMIDIETEWQGVEFYHLSQDRDQLWVLVNMV